MISTYPHLHISASRHLLVTSFPPLRVTFRPDRHIQAVHGKRGEIMGGEIYNGSSLSPVLLLLGASFSLFIHQAVLRNRQLAKSAS
jgi:hypothetical protein